MLAVALAAAPLVAASLAQGCGGTPAPLVDAGHDASPPRDAGHDAGHDAGPLPDCGEGSPLALGQCVQRDRYERDLRALALPRPPGSTSWMDAQTLCRTTFESLGFEVELHDYGTGVNVVGTRAGESEPDRRVLVSAHYDHIAGCNGADDNASGVAGVLEAARVLSSRAYPRTLVVACWDEEELGLVGSRAYADREAAAGRGFDVHFDLEMIGYADPTPGSQQLPPGFEALFPRQTRALRAAGMRADFIALIGDELAHDALTSLAGYASRSGLPAYVLEVSNELKNDPLLADLQRSDHAPFWAHDQPAIMLTDTADYRYDRYHCGAGPDDVESLDLDFATRVVSATVSASAESLGLAAP